MALRSGGRKLSFDILASSEYEYLTSPSAEPDAAIPRSHSDPPPRQNGASASSPPRKRKKRKSRKGKSSLNSESPTAETPFINGDVNYSSTLSTVTEAASVVPDLDSEVHQVTLSSVYGALRQRNVGNGVTGGFSEVNSDDSGSSKKDDAAKEEVAENWSAGGKESGQQGPEMNGRKLEKDGTLDWKEWMAKDANCSKFTRSIRFADFRGFLLICFLIGRHTLRKLIGSLNIVDFRNQDPVFWHVLHSGSAFR